MDRVGRLVRDIKKRASTFGEAQAIVINEYVTVHKPRDLAKVLEILQLHYRHLSLDALQKAS